jgi:hypothetical protein
MDDMAEGRVPEDSVSRCYSRGVDTVYGGHHHSPLKGRIGIPYRALLPRGIEGLLVAGRCISATHYVLGGIRGMGSVMGMGQGAGVAAALAAASGLSPRQVRPRDIQAALAKMGVNDIRAIMDERCEPWSD